MDVIASAARQASLHFDLPGGEDFYYESGIGEVTVPAHTMSAHARLRVGPSWKTIRYVVPLVAVAQYTGAGLSGDPYVKDFSWAKDEDHVWLVFILPIKDGSADYSGDFTYSVAIVGKLPSPIMRPKPSEQTWVISDKDITHG
jgi:hypothetical protein